MIKLKEMLLTVVERIAPFNFDGTFYVPHYFPTSDSKWVPGKYWQSMKFEGKLLGVKMVNKGTIAKPKIELTIYSKSKHTEGEIQNLTSELDWRFGFNENLSEFFEKFQNDEFLKPVFKRLKGMRVNCANSLYELLMISIVLQNATVRRTVQMMNNLLNAYGKKLSFDDKELTAYWRPEDLARVTEDELRALKVGYRAKMIKRVSEAFSKGEVDEFSLRKMHAEKARNEIMKLYGVGPATAQILLGQYLRRYDVLDLKGKFWEQKILSRIMFNRELVSLERIMEEFDKRYENWKGLAFHYIFTDLCFGDIGRRKSTGWQKKLDYRTEEL